MSAGGQALEFSKETLMKAVMSSVLPDVLAFRKRTGADRWDEMWEGVLHMPPVPTPEHQNFEFLLEAWLRRHWASRKRYRVYHNVNVASVGGWPNDYRVPDLVLLGPDCRAVQKGAHFEGPPDVVVEIRSPEDETMEKLPFYGALGVREVWVVERDTWEPRLYELQGKTLEEKRPAEDGWLRSAVTGVELRSKKADLAVRLQGDPSTLENLPGE